MFFKDPETKVVQGNSNSFYLRPRWWEIVVLDVMELAVMVETVDQAALEATCHRVLHLVQLQTTCICGHRWLPLPALARVWNKTLRLLIYLLVISIHPSIWAIRDVRVTKVYPQSQCAFHQVKSLPLVIFRYMASKSTCVLMFMIREHCERARISNK